MAPRMARPIGHSFEIIPLPGSASLVEAITNICSLLSANKILTLLPNFIGLWFSGLLSTLLTAKKRLKAPFYNMSQKPQPNAVITAFIIQITLVLPIVILIIQENQPRNRRISTGLKLINKGIAEMIKPIFAVGEFF